MSSFKFHYFLSFCVKPGIISFAVEIKWIGSGIADWQRIGCWQSALLQFTATRQDVLYNSQQSRIDERGIRTILQRSIAESFTPASDQHIIDISTTDGCKYPSTTALPTRNPSTSDLGPPTTFSLSSDSTEKWASRSLAFNNASAGVTPYLGTALEKMVWGPFRPSSSFPFSLILSSPLQIVSKTPRPTFPEPTGEAVIQ